MPRRPQDGNSPARARNRPAKRNGDTGRTIHARIYGAIIDHRIPPGTALLEEELAAAFGVSRTIVRKVLQQLAHERLVDVVPNKGASVAKPSAEEARQIFDARRALERILIERLAAQAGEAEIDELRRIVERERAANEAGDKHQRLTLSGDFHRRLAALAGNGVLAEFLNELVSRTSLIIALYESPGAVPCSHTEHMEIVDALKRHDAKKAAQYMDHHLQHIEAQIDLSEAPAEVDFKSLFRKRG
jgi:DNA-binding GntR family transcriptional regulator